MKTYRVKDWKRYFEINRTREMKAMRWVPVPNKHDGEGFTLIMRHPQALLIYGAWHLILQVASKCTPRGTLVREDGTPLTAKAISMKTRCDDVSAIENALAFLSSADVAWLEVVTTNPAGGCGNPAGGCATDREGREENDITGKGREEAAQPPAGFAEGTKYEPLIRKLRTHDDFRAVPVDAIINTLRGEDQSKWPEAVESLLTHYAGAHIAAPCRTLGNYLAGKRAANKQAAADAPKSKFT